MSLSKIAHTNNAKRICSTRVCYAFIIIRCSMTDSLGCCKFHGIPIVPFNSWIFMAFLKCGCLLFSWVRVSDLFPARCIQKQIELNSHLTCQAEEEVRIVHKCCFDGLMCTEVAASFVSHTQHTHARTHAKP